MADAADEASALIERIANSMFSGIKTNGGIYGAGRIIKLLGIQATQEHLYLAGSYCRKMARSLPRHKIVDAKQWNSAALAIEQELAINGKEYPER